MNGLLGGHRLTYLDQTSLELSRATGRGQLMQVVWTYEHPLDYEALGQFHRNCCESMLNRLIERSPLPFGRHRWVHPTTPPPPIHVAEDPMPREDLLQWANDLVDLPIDSVDGPPWRLVVQPFTDGSTAVSMLASHQVSDGIGFLSIIAESAAGRIRDPGYQLSGSRSPVAAVVSDFLQTVRDLPDTARAAVKAGKVFRAKRTEFAVARAAHSSAEDARRVVVPAITIYVGIPEWDSRAESLGGNGYTLVAGFAAKLGEHLGRRRSDGDVSLVIAVNTRESLDDDRALAMVFANATLDPGKVTSDLADAREAVREAREMAKKEPDPTIELLAIAPWLPQSAIKGIAEVMFDYSESLPVSCSHVGDLQPDVGRVDGTAAEYVFCRGIDTNVTLGELKRSKGQLVLVSGRINGMVSIAVEGYQLGAENTRERLHEIAEQTLSEFGLTGVIE